jgi:hypothetical protein
MTIGQQRTARFSSTIAQRARSSYTSRFVKAWGDATLRVARYAIALGALATITPFCSTFAAETELVSPIGDFAIVEPIDGPGMLDTYGETAPDPTWNIVQWDIPGGKLSPFKTVSPTVFRAQAPEAEVTVTRGRDPEKVDLRQDGALLPCLENGKPRESDLFLGPNGDNLRNIKRGMMPARPDAPALTGMARLVLRVTTSASFVRARTDKGCVVNQAGSLIGIVLSDFAAEPRQTMFYQLTLSHFCGDGPPERLKICNTPVTALAPYFTKDPFGIDDAMPLTGQSYVKAGEIRNIEMDILPRLKRVIETGPGSLDRDPSHWVLGSVYLGQHIWGDVRGETSWSDFHLTADSP